MSIRGKACIVGAYEHPTRKAPDKSVAQLHAEVTKRALRDYAAIDGLEAVPLPAPTTDPAQYAGTYRFDGPDDEEIEVRVDRDRLTLSESGAAAFYAPDRIVALAGAEQKPNRRCAHHATLGITVAKAFWGLGLGRRMMELLLDWGRLRKLRKMYLHVYADNERAIALYRSLGFVEEGRLREDVLRADGSFTDTIVMAKYYD